MTTQTSDVIVFDNLIEANNSKEATFGKTLSMPAAVPFQSSNAAGAICHMDNAVVSARAVAFGARFKAAMAR